MRLFRNNISSIYAYFGVLLLLNLSIIPVIATKDVHKCVPKSASSTIKCPTKEAKSYCRSTRGGHVFWASSKSPIAAAANSALDESEIHIIRDVLGKIDFVANQARISLDSRFGNQNCPDFSDKRYLGRYINTNQVNWARAAMSSGRRSNRISESNCFSEFKSAVDSRLSKELFETIDRFMNAIRKTAKALHERTREGTAYFDKLVRCWPKLYYTRDGLTEVYPFKCRVMAVAGVRRDGVFAIVTDLP